MYAQSINALVTLAVTETLRILYAITSTAVVAVFVGAEPPLNLKSFAKDNVCPALVIAK